MNISIIGAGYVGLVSGACFAKLGHNIIFVDIDENKLKDINNGISPIYEKGLEEILQKYHAALTVTTSYERAIQNSDITFICVGTPSQPDGDIDLSFIDQSVRSIAEQIKRKDAFHSVVVKSTVVPGTTKNYLLPLMEKISGKKAGVDFGMGMNPEFLREGVAVDDFLHPDRVVNGSIDEKTRTLLAELYKDFSCPIIETSLSVAEMIKYASNCFLATKISFINEIGNYCKHLGIDVYEVADGMGLDKRISRSFLNAGIGWGGSCFPKDTQALRAWAKKAGQETCLIDSVITVNDHQPLKMIQLLKRHVPKLQGKTIGILGLSFKPDTDDIRDSRSIPIIRELLKEKVHIKVYDPKAMEHFKKIFPDISYCLCAENVVDADAVLICTAWNEFQSLDYKQKLVIDGRRIGPLKNVGTYEGVCW